MVKDQFNLIPRLISILCCGGNRRIPLYLLMQDPVGTPCKINVTIVYKLQVVYCQYRNKWAC